MPGVQPGQRIAGDSALVRDAWPPVAARRQTLSRGPASSVDAFLCGGPAIYSEVQMSVCARSPRFVADPSRPVDLPPRSANVLNHKHLSLGFRLLEPFTRQGSQVRTLCRPPILSIFDCALSRMAGRFAAGRIDMPVRYAPATVSDGRLQRSCPDPRLRYQHPLVEFGIAPDEAIRQVRTARPGAIETRE